MFWFHPILYRAFLLIVATLSSCSFNVTVDPTPQQTLTSFGASGAWWPNDLILFPQSVQQQLAQFLFSQDGLYLSSYRYNMGGDGGNDTKTVTSSGRTVQSFLLRNGTYDFSRDHAGVTFAKYAQQYKVPYITFFINAAPSNISTIGAACGWTMTSDKVSPFATYIQTVLSHFSSSGLNISYISPMNEPDNSRSDCSQEGMSVPPTLRASVFNTLRSVLDSSPLSSKIGIIGDESATVTIQGILESPLWLPLSFKSLSGLAIHNYDFPPDSGLSTYRSTIQTLTLGRAPPVKFTETCCSTNDGTGLFIFGSQYDPTMTNALVDARYVWQFLTLAQAVSFDWWTAVATLPCSPSIHGAQCATAFNASAGFNSGLVYIDPDYARTGDHTLYFTKRAYVVKHFAYFHRPGSVRYDVPSAQLPGKVYAFSSLTRGKDGRFNLMFINQNDSPREVNLAVPAMGRGGLLRVVETSNGTDFGDVEPLPKTTGGVVKLRLPGESLWTLQFAAEE